MRRITCNYCNGNTVNISRYVCTGHDIMTNKYVRRVRYICDCCSAWGITEDKEKLSILFGIDEDTLKIK